MNQQPTSVTTFGVLNIVFGMCSFACLGLSVVSAFSGQQATGLPEIDAAFASQGFRIFSLVSNVLGALASIVLMACGVLLLSRKELGRTLSVGWGWFAIVYTLLSTIVTLAFLLPALSGSLTASGTSMALPLTFGILCALMALALQLVYPSLLIYYMTRPWMIAYFQGQTDPTLAYYPPNDQPPPPGPPAPPMV